MPGPSPFLGPSPLLGPSPIDTASTLTMTEGPSVEVTAAPAAPDVVLPGDTGGGVPIPDTPPLGTPQSHRNLIADRAWLLTKQTGLYTDGQHPDSDAILEGLVRGLLAPLERVSLIAHGDGGDLQPLEIVTNPDKAELWSIGYAAQFAGGTVPPRRGGETDEQYLTRARREVRRPRGMRRGSREALFDVAEPYRRGVKPVRIVERPSGDLWRVLFVAYSDDIIDQAGLFTALNDPAVVNAGMRVDLVLSDAPVWDESVSTWDATTATWDAVTVGGITPTGVFFDVAANGTSIGTANGVTVADEGTPVVDVAAGSVASAQDEGTAIADLGGA